LTGQSYAAPNESRLADSPNRTIRNEPAPYDKIVGGLLNNSRGASLPLDLFEFNGAAAPRIPRTGVLVWLWVVVWWPPENGATCQFAWC